MEEVGRIVLPIELRRSFGIDVGTELDIYPEDGRIIIEVVKDRKDGCIICNSEDNLLNYYKETYVCNNCIVGMSQKLNYQERCITS